jgi:hypothetical protein
VDDFFRNYNAPLIIEGAPGFSAERWNGLEAFAGDATKAMIPGLIDAIYGGAVPTALVSALQAKDESLTFAAGSASSRQLSAAALDYLFSCTGDLDVAAALAVMTADFGGRKPASLSVDIASRAAAELDVIADSWRSREAIKSEIAKIAGETPTAKAVAELAKGFDVEHTTAALTDVLKAVGRSLEKVAAATRSAFESVETRLNQVDEEADMLWFVFAGESEVAGGEFKVMAPALGALAAGIDLADRTRSPLHSKTFLALLGRLGVPCEPVKIQAAVEAAPTDFLTGKVERDPSARILPLHRLLDRYREFGSAAGSAWCAGSESVTGFAPDLEVSSHDLALQVYRERMLLKALAV